MLTKPLALKQKVGLNSEQKIIEFIYSQKNWQLIGQRLKTKFVEIDLLFYEQNRSLHIVEVKTIPSERIEHALSRNQAMRLRRFQEVLCEKFPTRTHLAVVSQYDQIQFIEDVLIDFV